MGARRWWGQKPEWRDRCAYRYSGRRCSGTGAPPLWMPSNKLYESDMGADSGDAEYAPASNSALLPRKRPLHGKLTAAILGGSVCLNAMLVLYCVNMQFMKPMSSSNKRSSEVGKDRQVGAGAREGRRRGVIKGTRRAMPRLHLRQILLTCPRMLG